MYKKIFEYSRTSALTLSNFLLHFLPLRDHQYSPSHGIPPEKQLLRCQISHKFLFLQESIDCQLEPPSILQVQSMTLHLNLIYPNKNE